MKYFTKFTIVLILFYMTSNTKIIAQFYLPANPNNPDKHAGTSGAVENTGNAVIPYLNTNQNIRAMVWDGDAPTFFVENDNNGNADSIPLNGNKIGAVIDPDIVLGKIGLNTYAFIVYLIDNSVYYEVWTSYNGNAWTNSISSTKISNTPGYECHSPNVDIAPGLSNVAITYEENNHIMLLGGSVTGNNITTQTIFDIDTDSRDPDVSVYYYFDLTTLQLKYVVNVTYIKIQGSNEELWITKYDFDGLLINNLQNYAASSIDIVNTQNGEEFGVPRTASRDECDDVNDYQIVVLKRIGSEYSISSYNYNNPTSPYIVNINSQHKLNDAQNFKPSIGYAGDECVVAWTYDDSQLGIGSGTIDVVSRQLYSYDGTGSYMNYYYNVFSIVNTNTNQTQRASSVDGRFTTYSQTEKLITFYDENNQSVNYKSVPAGTVQFRKPKTTIYSLYPNPASTNLTIQLQSDFEHTTIQIYNYLGGKVMEKKADEKNMDLDVSSLPSGLYFVKILSLTNTETIFFEILK